MEYVALTAGLMLPWLLGLALLVALGWPQAGGDSGGTAALRAGFGYCIGALLLTLWMRLLSAVGVAFGWLSIGLPLAIATAALLAFALRAGRIAPVDLRTVIGSLLWPPLPRWQRLVWIGLIGWLALRFLLLAADIAWQPLYPWDAWVQWATKARVWYELGRIAPFVRAEQWFASPGGAYFDAAPNYPATVPLLQVWSCIALGRWDDSAMNWPWLMLLIALTCAVYGALRGEGVAPLAALVGAYLVASLPLLDTHAALAGYADLPMATIYTLAALAFYRWAMRRDRIDAALALGLALCCPLIKIPGLVWALTLLPGVVVALMPRRGLTVRRHRLRGGTVRTPCAGANQRRHPRLPAACRFRSRMAHVLGCLPVVQQLESALVRRGRDGDRRCAAPGATAARAACRRRRHRHRLPAVRHLVHQRIGLDARIDHAQPRDAASGAAGRRPRRAALA